MPNPPLGDQELEVLRYIAEHPPISVGEVAERFGDSHGLARTTILTVMERLRRKGYLTRKKMQGRYRYSARLPKAELLRSLVRDFAERVLGGSLQPFVAYLTREARLTDRELAALRKLVRQLEGKRRGGA